jgi:selenophosphate synthetase-related protein
MPVIAKRGLAQAANDVSTAGIISTVTITADNSGTGALIELRDITCPAEVDPFDWLRSSSNATASLCWLLRRPAHPRY